jgi:hypothetical protein
MRVSDQSARRGTKREEEKKSSTGRDGLEIGRQLFEVIVKTRIIELLLIQKGIIEEGELEACFEDVINIPLIKEQLELMAR